MEIIHIVLGKANPNRLNGVNKVVYQMATEQTKAGKNVQVWGISSNVDHDYPERNFKTVLFHSERFPFAINSHLKKAIIDHKNSVFHLHGGWIPVFSSLATFFAKNNIRFVLTPHGAYNEVAMKRSAFRKSIYFQLFEKKILRHVHKVHSIGESEVVGLSKLSSTVTSFLLPYGFDIPEYKETHSKNIDFTVGFVGRLDVHTKGLDLLLEAFNIFQKENPNSKLWIIGDGDGKEYINNFIINHKLTNVVVWGKKFGEEKDNLISQMHVFAHPSRNEGLPTAVLEAIAMKTPVIVTKATNIAQYISDYNAGISIADENINEIVNGIKKLHNMYIAKEIDSLILNGKRMLQEVFSWSVLVNKYDELYK